MTPSDDALFEMAGVKASSSVGGPWDDEADVVVVGYGGAGVCAALEARAGGASVIAIDRFGGGGATAISGGVVYAGGGTDVQRAAGVDDDADNMFRYLQQEVKSVVSDETLRDFCDRSVENLEWLTDHGVAFDPSLSPVKTSYPMTGYYLYYSGNESLHPYRNVARPAQRGHLAYDHGAATGNGMSGPSLYDPLRASADARGVVFRGQSRVDQLVVEGGRVTGVVFRSVLPGRDAWLHARLHAFTLRWGMYLPGIAKRMRRWLTKIERRATVTRRVRAKRAVVIASGGFVYNREMVQAFAPDYRRGIPLGTTGDDGSGIALAASVGAALDRMGRVSAWRFINPPAALAEGIIVDRAGERYCNEQWYGATMGEKMVEEHGGEAILILDSTLHHRARSQVGKGKTRTFQTMPAWMNLYLNRKKAPTLKALAARCRVDPAGLEASVREYNRRIEAGEPDAFGKDEKMVSPIAQPPYYAIDCSINAKNNPCPTLTLGGLRVSEQTGQVLSEDGPIEGLYAAGRAAVGVASQQYVSGLSIADCVYSGRRAGRSAAIVERDAGSDVSGGRPGRHDDRESVARSQ